MRSASRAQTPSDPDRKPPGGLAWSATLVEKPGRLVIEFEETAQPAGEYESWSFTVAFIGDDEPGKRASIERLIDRVNGIGEPAAAQIDLSVRRPLPPVAVWRSAIGAGAAVGAIAAYATMAALRVLGWG